MQVQPIINAVQAALAGQGSLAGGDVAVEEAIDHLVAALAPAIRQAAMDLAEQAACEVRGQLPDRTVDLVLADGDPSLRIADAATQRSRPPPRSRRPDHPAPPSLVGSRRRRDSGRIRQQLVPTPSPAGRKPAQAHGFRMTHSRPVERYR
jgi:hypothetical protein